MRTTMIRILISTSVYNNENKNNKKRKQNIGFIMALTHHYLNEITCSLTNFLEQFLGVSSEFISVTKMSGCQFNLID